MRETATVLSLAQVEAAVDRTLDDPPRLLPPNSVQPALDANRAHLAAWIHHGISDTWVPSSEIIVPVSKGRHGVRPVGVWDLRSQVVYSGLVESLDPHAQAPVRGTEAWQAFLEGPLDLPGKYVVTADIAACYQYLDHAVLAQELLTLGCPGPSIDRICELLREATGRTYGLPQQSRPSDVLAEAYLDRLERAVTRRGVSVSRYNDDFRFNTESWSDVVRGLEILAEEARKLGLTLNDSKVFTWSKSKYKSRMEVTKSLRKRIADEAGFDMDNFETDYDEVFLTLSFDDPEKKVDGAAKILRRWQRVAGKGSVADGKQSEHRALLELVPLAFLILGTENADHPGVLDTAMLVLRYEQTLTPSVAKFLSTRGDGQAVFKAFDKALKSDAYFTGWQTWWLQHSLASIADFGVGTGSVARKTWLRNASKPNQSAVLRAAASLTRARHGLATKEELLEIYDRSSGVEQPMIVAALGRLKPDNKYRHAVVGDSKLHEWVFDWAAGLA